MKKILTISLVLLITIALLYPQIIHAQCKQSQIQTKKLIESGLVIEMRNGYREWYVDRAVWSVFTFSQKEQVVNGLSLVREKCDGYISIKVFDGHTGELLAKRGSFGTKIYK